MKPISIQLYTVRQYMPTEGEEAVLTHIAKAGYTAVEPGNVGEFPSAYVDKCKKLGLGVSSWFGPFPEGDDLQKGIDTALALGVKNVVCGLWIPEFESVEAIEKTAARINPAAAALKKAGLNLCLHNHWFEFDEIEGELAIERLLSLCPDLHLELDIYWAANFGAVDVASFLKKHAARVPLLHVKDGPLVKGEPHTALGKGKMPLAAILDCADPSVLAAYVVELDECGTDMWEAVEESAKFLHRYQG